MAIGSLTPENRHRRRRALALLASAALACAAAGPARAQSAGAAAVAAAAPDPDALPDDAFGRAVRYGRDLIVHTSALIGPDAPDPAQRYAGNGLECENCHLAAGTKPFGQPLARAWAAFPTFIPRDGAVRTLADRINGCLERSMNGRSLAETSAEMAAMLAYLRFLNQRPPGEPANAPPTPPLALPERPLDPAHGGQVFAQQCAACHGQDGLGQRLDARTAAVQRRRYAVPPLWGPDSFNDGAGMARPITAARFIRANMPFGTDPAHPALGVADAFDVAAFVETQPRPHFPRRVQDYPDLWLKPVDAAFPPLLGPFSAQQHRLGPWPPIQAWLQANRPKPAAGATGSE